MFKAGGFGDAAFFSSDDSCCTELKPKDEVRGDAWDGMLRGVGATILLARLDISINSVVLPVLLSPFNHGLFNTSGFLGPSSTCFAEERCMSQELPGPSSILRFAGDGGELPRTEGIVSMGVLMNRILLGPSPPPWPLRELERSLGGGPGGGGGIRSGVEGAIELLRLAAGGGGPGGGGGTCLGEA